MGCVGDTQSALQTAAQTVTSNKDLTPTVSIVRDPNCQLIGPSSDLLKSTALKVYPKAKVQLTDGEPSTMVAKCNQKVIWDKKEQGLFQANSAVTVAKRLNQAAESK